MAQTNDSVHTRAFEFVGYRYFWVSVLTTGLAAQIMAVAVAWKIYDDTGNALHLGLIGLVQFAPAFVLVLVTGWTSDRYSRRKIMRICLFVELFVAIGLLWFSVSGQTDIRLVFGLLFLLGIARAFMRPAEGSLAPNLVPPTALPNAVALTTSAWQSATIVGPAAAGLLYGISETMAYGSAIVLIFVSIFCVTFIPKPAQTRVAQETNMESLLAGFKFIFSQKVVLGSISLDLFAVLMGGAVALLPIYAKDILNAGPEALGLLRAAPGVGAILLAVVMSRIEIRNHAGRILLVTVALFGIFTTIFGFSTSVWVAVPALFLVGAADMVSVIIRETILQLWTPDEVRGRVVAVNAVFIGASNELGEFRAGVMAFWVGAVTAATFGGIATVGIAGIWAVFFPQLRDVKTLDKPEA